MDSDKNTHPLDWAHQVRLISAWLAAFCSFQQAD